MASRTSLHNLLKDILGSSNVYYQPPESIKMNYPAIVYNLYDIDQRHADNINYNKTNYYQIILIDKNPDSTFVSSIIDIPYCSFERFYTAENLNHFLFRLYY